VAGRVGLESAEALLRAEIVGPASYFPPEGLRAVDLHPTALAIAIAA
jgi:hypothetical protein